MRQNSLQYIVLIIGTIIFSALIYLLVEAERNKTKSNNTYSDFNQQTIEQVNVYLKPDDNSSIIATVNKNIKVKTTSETKYYFKIVKVDGHNDYTNGYILKTQLKRLE